MELKHSKRQHSSSWPFNCLQQMWKHWLYWKLKVEEIINSLVAELQQETAEYHELDCLIYADARCAIMNLVNIMLMIIDTGSIKSIFNFKAVLFWNLVLYLPPKSLLLLNPTPPVCSAASCKEFESTSQSQDNTDDIIRMMILQSNGKDYTTSSTGWMLHS